MFEDVAADVDVLEAYAFREVLLLVDFCKNLLAVSLGIESFFERKLKFKNIVWLVALDPYQ